MRSNEITEVKMEEISKQTFNEGELKGEGIMFYDSDSLDSLNGDQKAVFSRLLDDIGNYTEICKTLERHGGNPNDLKYLKERIVKIDPAKFKTPLNIIYVTHEPERKFMRCLFDHIELFDSFIKNPDRSFYSFPYSYKPETDAKTHVRQDNFNPDFFLKRGNDIIVVEIKTDEDDSKKNRAKYRDGRKHFEDLNRTLEANGQRQRYYFKFLSPEDYVDFFQCIREERYKEWKSSLMNQMGDDI